MDGLLSGSWGYGVGLWLLSESGRGCSLYRWGMDVCFLSRCFRGLCLSRGGDMVSEGHS